MKKTLLLFSVIALLFQAEAFSQEVHVAPANPAFVNYLNGNRMGAIPSPVAPVMAEKIPPVTQTLPASYDMRKLGQVTSIKNQLSKGPCGSCWTHSCMANIESLNLKLDNKYYDLSEDNLNNCHPPFDWRPCKGGNFYMSSAYLLRGSGPLLESQDPYMGGLDSSCPATQPHPLEYITDAWLIPINDRNLIKQTIMNYGGLDVSFYFSYNAIRKADSTFFFTKKYTNSTANCDTAGFGQWHEVSLIGWDDNKSTAASQPGAWIVKNSIVSSNFGDTTESAGFLYVSYYDSVAWQSAGCWPKKIPYDSTAILHYYDEGGYVSSFGYNNNAANYGVVKFIAPSNEQLKMLTTVAVYPNTTVSFDVYDNFNGTSLTGLLGSISTQTCTFAGFNSFNLSSPINITQGNDFYIRVKYNCATNHNYLIPIEMAYSGFTTNAVIETGKCWVSGNGTSWSSIGANTSSAYDLCIKAYATAVSSTAVHEVSAALANRIYPNPASTTVNIEMTDNSKKTITLRNIQGQALLSKQVSSALTSFNVAGLAEGVYFITIQSETGVQTLKFIKEE